MKDTNICEKNIYQQKYTYNIYHKISFITLVIFLVILGIIGEMSLNYVRESYITKNFVGEEDSKPIDNIEKNLKSQIYIVLLNIVMTCIFDVCFPLVIIGPMLYFFYYTHPGFFRFDHSNKQQKSLLKYCDFNILMEHIQNIIIFSSSLILLIVYFISIYSDPETSKILNKTFNAFWSVKNVILLILAMVAVPMYFLLISKVERLITLYQEDINIEHTMYNSGTEISIFRLQDKLVKQHFKTKFCHSLLFLLKKILFGIFVCTVTFVFIYSIKNILEKDENQSIEKHLPIIIMLIKYVLKVLMNISSVFSGSIFLYKYFQLCKQADQFFKNKTQITAIESIKLDGEINIPNGIKYTINQTFMKGNIYHITGPSGIGKTNIIYSILQMPSLFNGNILVNDHNINTINYQSLYNNISVLMQSVNLVGDSYECNLHNMEKMQSLFPIVKLKYNKFQYLSGGEKQKLGLIRAIEKIIHNKSKLLLLDEPFSAMDPASIEKVKSLLMEITEKYKIIVILIDHTNSFNEKEAIKIPLI